MSILFRLRLLFFRPSWQHYGFCEAAYHAGLVAVVVKHRTTGMYGWTVYRNLKVVAEGQYLFANKEYAKKIARAGLLAGEK